MTEHVCVVTGVGPGTGAALSRRFAEGGYRVGMLARSEERLRTLEGEIEGSRGYVCDVSDPAAIVATLNRVKSEIGTPSGQRSAQAPQPGWHWERPLRAS